MQTFHHFIDINELIQIFWKSQNQFYSARGIFKLLTNPKGYIKITRSLLKFQRTGDHKHYLNLLAHLHQVFQFPDPVWKAMEFYRNQPDGHKLPLNILVSHYLIEQHPDADYEQIQKLNQIQIPVEQKWLSPKTLSAILAGFVAILFKAQPKILEDFGINFESLFNDSDAYSLLVLAGAYILFYVGLLALVNYRNQRFFTFRKKILETCVVLQKEPTL
ncbi:hypothetical protein [Pontibacter sp. G13]|uniref:hypothetical protein n=1 Tax=Pontibacter sp. G13 TaxID=3074898 RepID=UPI00288AE1D3|nr:hypothetical protein [Pontibacter sp. G13]WNJ18332.1 hypothetical protein RJD25_26055 [Pontibacter sp. G13]